MAKSRHRGKKPQKQTKAVKSEQIEKDDIQPNTEKIEKAKIEKAAKAEQASSEKNRAKQRAQELKRKQQQRRLVNMSVIFGIIAVVVVTVIFFVNQPAEAPIPEGTLERYAALPQSQVEGFFVLGNPAAPVRVVEYSSFTCPACLSFYEGAMDTIIKLAQADIISYRFVPRFVGSYQNAEGAAKAAFCAGEQGAFFEMHDALFEWQALYGNTAFTQNRLVSGADELGLDTGAFRSCLNSSRADNHVRAANNEANSLGFVGAPITTVNGVQVSTNVAEIRQQVIAAQGNQPPVPVIVDETLPPSASDPESTPEPSAADDD